MMGVQAPGSISPKNDVNMAIILETQRLLLRHLVIDDLEYLWTLYCDPQITKYIPDAPKTHSDARQEFEWHMLGHPNHPELGLWATVHKATGKFIGRCGLLPWTIEGRYEVEVAYLLAREYWRHGLGTEVAQAITKYGFENLHLSRLICLIDRENTASQRVAEKIGMTFEKEGQDEMGPFLIFAINK
jgi:RimJ/RimL family protein N-acetyltransferase